MSLTPFRTSTLVDNVVCGVCLVRRPGDGSLPILKPVSVDFINFY